MSQGSAMLFAKAVGKCRNHNQFSSLGSQSSGVTLDNTHIEQVRKKAVQRQGVLGPFLYRRSGFSIRNGVLPYKQLMHPMMEYACPFWRSAACSHTRKLRMLQSNVFALLPVHLGTLVMGKYTVIWGSPSLLTTAYL